jgi:lipoate synthase
MPLDPQEPQKIAESVRLLGLSYVVLTSVARDDLPDQGAGWFVATMKEIRASNPETQIEVLTADFWGGAGTGVEGQKERINSVVRAKPACYNHNIETVQRLQGRVRRGAKYERSLAVLQFVKDIDPSIPTKSGLMLGHGESSEEVIETMADLRQVGCDRLTIGQYMAPLPGTSTSAKILDSSRIRAVGSDRKGHGIYSCPFRPPRAQFLSCRTGVRTRRQGDKGTRGQGDKGKCCIISSDF